MKRCSTSVLVALLVLTATAAGDIIEFTDDLAGVPVFTDRGYRYLDYTHDLSDDFTYNPALDTLLSASIRVTLRDDLLPDAGRESMDFTYPEIYHSNWETARLYADGYDLVKQEWDNGTFTYSIPLNYLEDAVVNVSWDKQKYEFCVGCPIDYGDFYIDASRVTLQVDRIPEPVAMSLLAVGAGLALLRRRR